MQCLLLYMLDKTVRPVYPFSWAGLITAAAGRHILRLPFVRPLLLDLVHSRYQPRHHQDIIGAATEQFVGDNCLKIKVSTKTLDTSMGGIYTIAIVVKIKYISSVDIYISIHSLEYTHALMFPWDISGLQYPASLLYTLCCHQSNDLLSIGHFILHNLSRKVITDRYRPGCWCRARERMAKECSLHTPRL